MKVRIIRSKRKTMSLQITDDAEVVVRAPRFLPESEIRRFVTEKSGWIEKHLAEVRARRQAQAARPPLTEEEWKEIRKKAKEIIPARVSFYAEKLQVTYGKITIRHQKTLWGSCTGKGNLSFNCLLVLTPPEVLDSVVVHELCHRKEMNHSAAFYRAVYSVYPQYDACHQWLKEHGKELLGLE